MRLNPFGRLALLVLPVSLLTACSVYAPLQSGTPLLHEKGEAEVTAGTYLSGRLEGAVAYSPWKHVMVRAAGGLKANNKDSTYFRNRQFELGVGTYRQLGNEWLVGGLAGYGRGQGSRRFTREPFESAFTPPQLYHYQARYQTISGEVYAAHEGPWTNWGFAYRLSQVHFGSLTNLGQPLPLRRMTRHEPLVFMRFGSRQGILHWGQLQVATSLTWSSDYVGRRSNYLPLPLADTKEVHLFTSVGLVVYPHQFGRGAEN